MKTLTLIGRRWFRKGPGGTYHTVSILVDGVEVHKTPMTYGYDDQYKETALDYLEKEGLLKPQRAGNGSREPLWRLCERLGITLSAQAIDVQRERDL